MLNVIKLSVIMLNFVVLSVIMLNVIMLNVVMLSVIMLNVVMLSAVAPFLPCLEAGVRTGDLFAFHLVSLILPLSYKTIMIASDDRK
jgi:hypothetical protein